MSRQIQLRRGTATQNNNFTGAEGEVTFDTDAKTLRVHDGQTLGGIALAKHSDIPTDISTADYVIAFQRPTAENNYKWYRKYKSGWVEQGGYTSGTSAGEYTIPLHVEMLNKNYNFFATFDIGSDEKHPKVCLAIRRQRNSVNDTTRAVACISTYANGATNDYTGWAVNWMVCGMRAQ